MDREPGLRCRSCGGKTRVVDSREAPAAIRRRRVCLTCEFRFTSYERWVGEADKSTDAVARIAALAELIRAAEAEIRDLSEILAS